MFNTWKILDEKNQVITTLWIVLILMILMNVYMYFGWQSASREQRIFFPPDLAKGGIFQVGEVPSGQVYAFGFHIFAGINTWSDVGSKDYEKQIIANKPYVSTSFYNYLASETNRKEQLNELNRTRIVFDENTGFKPDTIIKVSSNTWHVEYRFHIQEAIGTNIFKEWIEVYPITIRAINTSIEYNPWGLVIDGFYKEPYKEKDII